MREWRPKGWQNPYKNTTKHFVKIACDAFERGADAMLKALKEKGAWMTPEQMNLLAPDRQYPYGHIVFIPAEEQQLPGQPTEEPFWTFYLIDFTKQNGRLFWRWTGTPKHEWKEVGDILSFLNVYYPLSWHAFIIETMELP